MTSTAATMRAAVHRVAGDPLSLETVATPSPGAGEVLVRVTAAGVCHSDVHLRDGVIPPFRMPLILGHEIAGTVVELGDGAAGVAVGDEVVVFGGWGCGACGLCLAGTEQLCDKSRWVGLGPDGGFADFVLVPSARHLVPAPGLDPAEAAALTDAGLTPYHAVGKALPRLVPGSVALVIGAGGLGQYGLQLIALRSAATVVVVETSEAKRAIALELGADAVIDGAAPDVLEQIRAIAGEGVVAAFDFVGSDATMRLAAAALRRQGMLVLVGLAGGVFPWRFLDMPAEAQLLTSDLGTRAELVELVALATSGRLRSRVERFDLADLETALQRLDRGEIAGRAVLIP